MTDIKSILGDIASFNANLIKAAEAHPEVVQAIIGLVEALAKSGVKV